MSMRRAPECLSALVTASRPMRSRWCSCDASSRARRSLDAHVRRGVGAERHLPRQFGQRAGEVAAFERLRAQIEHGSPRLLEAVAQHLPRHVERLLRPRRRALERGRDRFELEGDPRQSLLERVVQLAPDARPLGQHGLVLLALALAARLGPDDDAPGAEAENREHHARVPQRPPRRRREQDHVVGRAQQEAERRRGTGLIGVDAGDGDEAARPDPIERSAGGVVEVGVEDRFADPHHEGAAVGVGEHAQQLAFHAHERGVVVRASARSSPRRPPAPAAVPARRSSRARS